MHKQIVEALTLYNTYIYHVIINIRILCLNFVIYHLMQIKLIKLIFQDFNDTTLIIN
jgi:hypothetical protein